jgi:hypothetical protein
MNAKSGRFQVPVLVVERYWPSVTAAGYLEVEAASGAASTILASIVFAEDDRVLSLVVDGSIEAVEAANRAGRLPFIRVVQATAVLPAGLAAVVRSATPTVEVNRP